MPIHPSEIDGFLEEPQHAADGSIYRGRITLHDIQWTHNPDDTLATTTVTLQQLVDASENRLLWTDQTVQRGFKPEVSPLPALELPLADGYPDLSTYIFHVDKANEMAEKLLNGEKFYINPLIWNIRPGSFTGYWNEADRQIYLYDGKIFLPDSHHRHQAILKAFKTYSDAPDDYPAFQEQKQFTINLYFMSKDEEAEFFYEKNILGTPTAKSKAFDLTTQDSLSVLAKAVIEKSPSLTGNVNRVTDRLTAKNPQVMTLSTLRAVVETVVGEKYISASAIDNEAEIIACFYEMLVGVRPELGHLSEEDRKTVRTTLLSESAVMMHGYARLIKEFSLAAVENSLEDAKQQWEPRVNSLAADNEYVSREYSGDFFARSNPIWKEYGVIQKTKSGKDTLSNTRQTRATCGELLMERVGED